jgi:glucose-1-phosphate thymidylyltransferase
MDGVLLTGGKASRLGPITKVTNKHLLPIYDKPMIFYGIETLKELGCERVIIILGGNSVGDIVNLVRDGSQFNVEVIYKFQDQPKGISHAISLTKDIILNEESQIVKKILVLLGDNIFGNAESLKESVDAWVTDSNNPTAVFLHSASNPHEYGQPILKDEGMTIERFVEKDTSVDHNLIVTGLYGLDDFVFDTIDKQVISPRGEYEITDTLTQLLPYVKVYGYSGFWSDCGTPEGLVEASQYMREKDKA